MAANIVTAPSWASIFARPRFGPASWLTLLAGVMIFAASLWSTRLLPSGFIPADDLGRALLAIELPPGSRLDNTDRVVR